MKRIIFIVVWFFAFTLIFCISSLAGAFVVFVAGFKSASDFFINNLFTPLFVLTMILALAFGMCGFLPGTKQLKIEKIKPPLEIRGLRYIFLRTGLFFMLFWLSLPVGEGLFWLTNSTRNDWINFPIGALYLFGLGWFVKKTAEHMTFEEREIFDAMKYTFGDLRLRLTFLPWVGKWFVSDSDKCDTGKQDGH